MPKTFVPEKPLVGSGRPKLVPPRPAGLPNAHSPWRAHPGSVSREKNITRGGETSSETVREIVAWLMLFEKTMDAAYVPTGRPLATELMHALTVLPAPAG